MLVGYDGKPLQEHKDKDKITKAEIEQAEAEAAAAINKVKKYDIVKSIVKRH
jgi:hypothetical protein